ncbi:MAG TPA: PspC domain-containing protein [bacterium]|jgi:phage shock protein C|nr:PspC domain-containing protein [bacterium]
MTRLYRSRSDRWIAGVCGGLAEYFGVDATAVRIAFVLLALWQGFGVLIYVVLALIIPEGHAPEMAAETGPAPPPDDDEEEHQRRTRLLGGLLIVGGGYVLLRNSPMITALWGDNWVGALLVLGGLLILLLRRPH